jgi:hypothetical protein
VTKSTLGSCLFPVYPVSRLWCSRNSQKPSRWLLWAGLPVGLNPQTLKSQNQKDQKTTFVSNFREQTYSFQADLGQSPASKSRHVRSSSLHSFVSAPLDRNTQRQAQGWNGCALQSSFVKSDSCEGRKWFIKRTSKVIRNRVLQSWCLRALDSSLKAVKADRIT